MVISDPELYRKMIGLWQCTKIPGLQARIDGASVKFSWDGERKGAHTLALTPQMFFKLEPVEIRDMLELAITQRNKVNAKQWRNDFRAFSKNPLE